MSDLPDIELIHVEEVDRKEDAFQFRKKGVWSQVVSDQCLENENYKFPVSNAISGSTFIKIIHKFIWLFY